MSTTGAHREPESLPLTEHRPFKTMPGDRCAASAIKPRRFLATPNYLRLWFAGGIGNAMRWLELLAAGIFTYEVTHSTILVALVTVARSLPMLFIGTIAGVIGEALNRKRLLVTQLLIMSASSAMLCVLRRSSPRRATR